MSDERYQHRFRCCVCATQFTRTRNSAEWIGPRPNCPKKCEGRVKDSYVPDVERTEVQAPAIVGSISAKAFDTAMEMTMQDQGMTNINDSFRQGEPTAPKLRPDLQAKADSFFAGPQRKPANRGRVDMSPIFGERATQSQSGMPPAKSFDAHMPTSIAPIMEAAKNQTSAVPNYRVVAEG